MNYTVRNTEPIEIAIYRKPTTTDFIIPKSLCHPIDYKIPAIRQFCDIIHNHPLEKPDE
jgi:hypothetical protein